MRILLIHPNYHSGGAEIAGNWPPAWAAYLTGSLKAAGYQDIRFIDAMTNNISDDHLRDIIAEAKPDVVGATAITPSIYKAERALQIAKEVHPNVITVLGGIHATFMYQQVLTEAPWIDVIVRGEGEEILLNLIRAIDEGRWPADAHTIKGPRVHAKTKRSSPPPPPPPSRTSIASKPTGAFWSGTNISTSR